MTPTLASAQAARIVALEASVDRLNGQLRTMAAWRDSNNTEYLTSAKRLEDQIATMRPVIEAAKAWCNPDRPTDGAELTQALCDAVDALAKLESQP